MRMKKEKKAAENKRPPKVKTVSAGLHKKSVLFLWVLLIGSVAFGIYKNFTAVDTHTVHETERIEEKLVDTNAWKILSGILLRFTIHGHRIRLRWKHGMPPLAAM